MEDNWGGVGNSEWGSMDSVGNWGHNNWGVGTDNWGGVDSVGNWGNNLDWSVGWDTDSWSVLGLSGVGDILNNTISVVRVSHGLDTTIGKVDSVAAAGGVSVSLLSLGKVGSAVVISDSVVVSVHWRLSQVVSDISSSVWGSDQDSGGESGGDSEEGSSNESLKC